MANHHKHLFNCEHNETVRRCCIACKFDAWQAQCRKPVSVVGKELDQLLTTQDKELLHDMFITV